MELRKQVPLVAMTICTVWLQACVGVAANTSTLAVKSAARDDLRPLAESGDDVAQYELGKSYCCMGPGFDTQTATEWLCKSAHQGNADAMYELGRIYRGDVSRTLAPGQKLMRALKARTSMSHALMWLGLAAQMDHAGASAELAELEASEDVSVQKEAMAFQDNWHEQACEYEDVFPVEADN